MKPATRQSVSALIAATALLGLPAANAVAAVRATTSTKPTDKQKAAAAAAAAAAAKKAAAAKAAAAKGKSAATTTAATSAGTKAPQTIHTGNGTVTVGPALDPLPETGFGSKGATGERTVVGDEFNMDQWGPVTVTIVIAGGKIVEASADMPMERARSAYINSHVGPYLNKQAVQLQSSKLDIISGATRTCQEYAESLKTAMQKAGLTP